MVNLISHEKLERIIEAIEQGRSLRMIAAYARVSKHTAYDYRKIALECEVDLPTKCGCGRPIMHKGRCNWRRKSANPSLGKENKNG
jgi:hypothetical protein